MYIRTSRSQEFCSVGRKTNGSKDNWAVIVDNIGTSKLLECLKSTSHKQTPHIVTRKYKSPCTPCWSCFIHDLFSHTIMDEFKLGIDTRIGYWPTTNLGNHLFGLIHMPMCNELPRRFEEHQHTHQQHPTRDRLHNERHLPQCIILVIRNDSLYNVIGPIRQR